DAVIPRPPRSPLSPYTTLFRSKITPEELQADRTCILHDSVRIVDTDGHKHPQDMQCEEDVDRVNPVNLGDVDLECKRNEEQEKQDRKSTRLNSSHVKISYAVFC